MKKLLVFILLIIFSGNRNITHCQTIQGQIVTRFLDTFDPLYGIRVVFDSISVISDNNGLFQFDSVLNKPDSIVFLGSFQPKVKLINLPTDYDTLNLGTIELISYKIISQNQYDSLQSELIKTFEPDLEIVQQNKADMLLKTRYRPIYNWAQILGYFAQDEIESNKMIHPYDINRDILIDYDPVNDIIVLDYSCL